MELAILNTTEKKIIKQSLEEYIKNIEVHFNNIIYGIEFNEKQQNVVETGNMKRVFIEDKIYLITTINDIIQRLDDIENDSF